MSIPVLIETSPELKAHLDIIAEYVNKDYNSITYYGAGINNSHAAVVSYRAFVRAIRANQITPKLVAELETYYRDYRGREDATNTNIYFSQQDMDDLVDVVEFLSKTGVRHLYHGKRVNKKMIVMFGIRYMYLKATQDQQG